MMEIKASNKRQRVKSYQSVEALHIKLHMMWPRPFGAPLAAATARTFAWAKGPRATTTTTIICSTEAQFLAARRPKRGDQAHGRCR